MKFQIVDAFTRQTFGGNPAGVVLLPEGAEFPADETMRKTAAELRYSETAFIKPLGGNRFQIRYFTPAAEVELCGDATIGSFHALQEMGLVVEGGTYIDETLSGTPSSWTWPSPRPLSGWRRRRSWRSCTASWASPPTDRAP